ncbi:ThiamineS/Molybdopterin converting factor subunit 1 [Cladochytrium replicatum]|nr:ThiamineS/Molybdopterin converting factor subunit 1 [Cladochytrium replicatum]
MVQVKVLYFSSSRNAANGLISEELKLDSTATVATLLSHLRDTYGDMMKKVLSTSMVAVNLEYVEKDGEDGTVLNDGDEVSIIPPVSGG